MLTATNAKLETTTYIYDADGHLQSITGPVAGATTSYTYDGYGRARTTTDSDGYTLTTDYDAMDRPTRTTFPDASDEQIVYDKLDAGQWRDRLGRVSRTLHDALRRVVSTTDSLGRTVTQQWCACGSLDALIDANGHATSWRRDLQGRITREIQADDVTATSYAYETTTSRVKTVTDPKGQVATYSYNAADTTHQITFTNASVATPTVSYTYDAAYNRLSSMTDGTGTTNYSYEAIGSDGALLFASVDGPLTNDTPVPGRRMSASCRTVDELLTRVDQTTDATPVTLKRQAFAYDSAGNKLAEEIDDIGVASSYDSFYRLRTQQPGGWLRVAGTVSEPAAMTVQGSPAAVSSDNHFVGRMLAAPGTSTLTITATDASGNAETKQFQVDASGSARTLTYDANGNLSSDRTRTFEWDARNQLVAVNAGTRRVEFAYDGLQRRVRVVERDGGIIQTDTRLVWCETTICEERAADGVTVVRRSFSQGEQVGGAPRFFTSDHLGSVREVADGSATLLARYAFDPWGRRTLTAGTDITTVGFTRHRWDATSGLWLTMHRGLDAELGRWISPDPLGLGAGLNRFEYVHNRVIVRTDPLWPQGVLRAESQYLDLRTTDRGLDRLRVAESQIRMLRRPQF